MDDIHKIIDRMIEERELATVLNDEREDDDQPPFDGGWLEFVNE